jgi:hypothetical protein
MIQFNDKKNTTHELSLSVHDSGEGWNVWLAEVEGDTRYFEAADDLEVWDLIDLAVHCYDEEKPQREDYWEAMRQDAPRYGTIEEFLADLPQGEFKATLQPGEYVYTKETIANAVKPDLYRKLLSPEEFTD